MIVVKATRRTCKMNNLIKNEIKRVHLFIIYDVVNRSRTNEPLLVDMRRSPLW